MKINLFAFIPALLTLPLAALEPARTTRIGLEKRDAIFLRAESGAGLVAFVPEGKSGWRLTLYPGLGSVAAFPVAVIGIASCRGRVHSPGLPGPCNNVDSALSRYRSYAI